MQADTNQPIIRDIDRVPPHLVEAAAKSRPREAAVVQDEGGGVGGYGGGPSR